MTARDAALEPATGFSPPPARQITGPRAGVTKFPGYDAAVLGLTGFWYPVM